MPSQSACGPCTRRIISLRRRLVDPIEAPGVARRWPGLHVREAQSRDGELGRGNLVAWTSRDNRCSPTHQSAMLGVSSRERLCKRTLSARRSAAVSDAYGVITGRPKASTSARRDLRASLRLDRGAVARDQMALRDRDMPLHGPSAPAPRYAPGTSEVDRGDLRTAMRPRGDFGVLSKPSAYPSWRCASSSRAPLRAWLPDACSSFITRERRISARRLDLGAAGTAGRAPHGEPEPAPTCTLPLAQVCLPGCDPSASAVSYGGV